MALPEAAVPARRLADVPAGTTPWHAELELELGVRGGRTCVLSRAHRGPLCIQKPFHPEDGACHVYVLHPPGGLAGGDELDVRVKTAADAHALVTTPAATKFYRTAGRPSRQTQALAVADGAALEWLPLDTILFGGSAAEIETTIALHPGARFIGWDVVSLGRPLSGDRYASGSFRQRLGLAIGATPALRETTAWEAGDRMLAAPWGLAGHTVLGNLYAYPAGAAELDAVRERLGECASITAGATRLEDVLVVRALADDVEALANLFESLWAVLRPGVIGTAVCRPRIWGT